MPEFVALGYPTQQAAIDARLAMLRLAPGNLHDLGDAVVASVDDLGTIDVDQLVNLWTLAPKGKMLRTLLLGLLFFYPLLTVLPGNTPRLMAAALRDFGLGEDALRRIWQMLTPGHAVIFMLISPAVLPVLDRSGTGPVEVQHIDGSKFDLVASAFDQGQRAASGQQSAVYSRHDLDD